MQRGRQLLERFQHFYDALCRLSRPLQRRWQRKLGASLAGVALALALSNAPASYAFPSSGNASLNGGPACELIDAITAANTDSDIGGCGAGNPGADTITLLGDVTLTSAILSTYGDNGLPVITSVITIEGAGHTIARDAGASNFRILTVGLTGGLNLNATTITGGSTTEWGGGISNFNGLTLSNSTVSGNSASSGGGIFNDGTMLLSNSTVSGNSAGTRAGGIQNGDIFFPATLTLERSLISGNSAPNAPEIYNYNTAYFGPATVNSNNYNLIGHDGNAGSTNFTPSGSDIVPSQALADILGPLADNGGGALTHALVTGSPAVDAAPTGPATDQRGVARPQGAAFDIGAYELEQGASNTAPTVAADHASVTVDEGETATNTGTVSDPDDDDVTLSASLGTVVNNGDGTWSWSFDTTDGPPDSQTVTITADDGNDGVSETSFDLTVNNVAPTVGAISAPVDPQQVGTTVNASAPFSDPGTDDTHTAEWDWGDGNTSAGTVGSGAVGPDSHTYTTPGVYTVKLTVTDDDGGVGESIYQFVVVYDPAGGFVTGGGWITSPEGAYPANPSLTGKANFGFNSKYKNGQSTPSGNTQFQFKVADLKFQSSSYEWLVVAGPHAKFKGVGTINGSGNYGFMLTATDGQVNGGGGIDKFRIKIWDRDNGDAVVYDNQMGQGDDSNAGTALGGGSIVIHSGGANAASADDEAASAQANRIFLPVVTR